MQGVGGILKTPDGTFGGILERLSKYAKQVRSQITSEIPPNLFKIPQNLKNSMEHEKFHRTTGTLSSGDHRWSS